MLRSSAARALDPVLGERSAGVADRLEPVALHAGSFPSMEHARARRLGARAVGDRPRLVADLRRRRRPRAGRGVHPRGLRGGHHVLRHRQRVRARRGGAGVGRDPLRVSARLLRAGDEGVLPDGAARQRALARADPQADRRLAGAAAHRPRRPLPVPPLRRGDAAGGDDGRADRGRGGRQGALHRLQRVARRSGSSRRWRCPAWRASSPASRSTPRSGASPSARCSRCARATGSARWSGRRSPRAC